MRRYAWPVLCWLAVLAAGVPAFAVHDARLLELDADARDGAPAAADWSSALRDGEAVASLFVADGAAPPADASYFTGGGSKDVNDVTAWRHTTGDVAPDKNEITNAYALAYRNGRDTGRNDPGDLLIYFGLDRYANNGDAQVGFWFLRDAVAARADGTFTGRHRAGDLLVLSDFTQGGKVGTVRVFRWVGSGGSEGPLDLVVSGARCRGTLRDDAACATVNTEPVSSPWAYSPKAGADGAFPAGSFFEGGINVSRLSPGVTCFSSYLAETRSSSSVDAQLKDLALGPFDTCPATPVAEQPRRPTPRTVSAPAPARPVPSGPQLANGGPGGSVAAGVLGVVFLTAGVAARARAGRLARLGACDPAPSSRGSTPG